MKFVTLRKDGKFIGRTWQQIALARDFAREELNGADIYVNGSFFESVKGCKWPECTFELKEEEEA